MVGTRQALSRSMSYGAIWDCYFNVDADRRPWVAGIAQYKADARGAVPSMPHGLRSVLEAGELLEDATRFIEHDDGTARALLEDVEEARERLAAIAAAWRREMDGG